MRRKTFSFALVLTAGAMAYGFAVTAQTSKYPELTGLLAGGALTCLLLMTVYFFSIAGE